ncbi:MAG: carbohydrate kinase family protein [Deltaproteobacteria bacterium]|nr:carbohydrate kinase family protein [Deltaproteobacteria bacterium]MBW1987334.1 carbohydrate kinase family protein [Deltaproteobacteria bacterium]
MQIFISGSLAYDRIMDFPGKFADHILPDKIHILNVCFMVNGLIEKFGGTAGNIAYNLALLGERPVILATAGHDFDRYEDRLRRLGLPLVGIRSIPEEFTAGAYITTDQSDNQITGFNPGAMKYPSLFQFDGVKPSQALAIVAPGNLEDMLTYTRIYKERRVRYIFDPGQSLPQWSKKQLSEMITGSGLLISNDYELEMIIKTTGLDKAELLQRTGAIITTHGEKGSMVISRAQEVQILAAKAAKVVDPTGAGDAFRAGLIKGLVLGHSLADAARLGATCASYAVEYHGTQEHHFTIEDFWARHRANFN